jgi:glutathione S-transferase
MADIVFFHGPRSLDAKILKVVLLEKKCDFEARKVNSYKMGDLRPVNGKHILPDGGVLYRHGNVVLEDFMEIIEDLEKAYPSPIMLPEDEQGQAVQEKWLEYIYNLPMIELLHDQTGFIIRNGLKAVYEHRIERLEHAAKSRPQFAEGYTKNIEYAKRMLAVLNDKYDDYTVSQKLFEFLNNMEAALLGKNYLTGDNPKLMDFIIAVSLHSLKEAGLAGMWQGGKFPRVSMFYSRFSGRPSFAKVCLEKNSLAEDLYLARRSVVYLIKMHMTEPV